MCLPHGWNVKKHSFGEKPDLGLGFRSGDKLENLAVSIITLILLMVSAIPIIIGVLLIMLMV